MNDPAMQRTRRLRAFWAWLPAFRVVAETQHLPAASKILRVNPSSISRMIRLLEDDLGRRLFVRSGRSLHLNAEGQQLLAAVRVAMRAVDDGVSSLESGGFAGPLVVAAPAWLAARYLGPAMVALCRQHPALSPRLIPELPDGPRALQRGDVDLVVTSAPEAPGELGTAELPALPTGLYARDAKKPPPGLVIPLGLPRAGLPHVVLEAEVDAALELARSGTAQAVLPKVVGDAAGLALLRHETLPALNLVALRRHPLGNGGPVDAILEQLQQALAPPAGAPQRRQRQR